MPPSTMKQNRLIILHLDFNDSPQLNRTRQYSMVLPVFLVKQRKWTILCCKTLIILLNLRILKLNTAFNHPSTVLRSVSMGIENLKKILQVKSSPGQAVNLHQTRKIIYLCSRKIWKGGMYLLGGRKLFRILLNHHRSLRISKIIF